LISLLPSARLYFLLSSVFSRFFEFSEYTENERVEEFKFIRKLKRGERKSRTDSSCVWVCVWVQLLQQTTTTTTHQNTYKQNFIDDWNREGDEELSEIKNKEDLEPMLMGWMRKIIVNVSIDYMKKESLISGHKILKENEKNKHYF